MIQETQWATDENGERFLLDPPPRKTRKERLAAQAASMRARRAATAHVPEPRVVDRCVVEALTVVLDGLDRAIAGEIILTLQPLVVDALVERGHARPDAKVAFDGRMRGLMAPTGRPKGLVARARMERSYGREPGHLRRLRDHGVTG